MERGDDFLAVSDLLSRNDLLDFVQEAVDESFSRTDFDRLRMPEGTSSQTMWDFVEFVRRAGCGRVVCGKDRGCDHMGSWYALTNSLSSRIARIEHRVRPQGSLTVHFRRYIEASGYYAPLLDEVAFVLGMDGVRVEMTDLRRIARGIAGGGFVSSALHGEERLMAFVLEVLAGMDGYAPSCLTPLWVATALLRFMRGWMPPRAKSALGMRLGTPRPPAIVSATCLAVPFCRIF